MTLSMRETKSALIVMDVQPGIVARLGDGAALLDRLNQAIAAARTAAMRIVFVRVAFRPGYPEANPANRGFAAIAKGAGDAFTEQSPATQVHPELHPQPDDPIVVKKRVSAFAGSDLEILLRSLSVSHLVLAGIATSGVVLSTVREAADRDYQVTVLSDGCADADEEVHRVLTTKVFPRQADVLGIDEWVSRLKSHETSSGGE
jgi:nicotinamidase-related amidase